MEGGEKSGMMRTEMCQYNYMIKLNNLILTTSTESVLRIGSMSQGTVREDIKEKTYVSWNLERVFMLKKISCINCGNC